VTTEDDALRLLSGGEVALIELMPHSSNYTFLAEVRHPDSTVLGVYKPRKGERPLWDFPEGTLYRREVAAFELSRALGWPAVPPTVVRDGPHGPGSMQLFVESDPNEHFFTLRDGRLDDFAGVALFDAIANNADRKSGHCLLGPDGIYGVDNGLCFHVEPKLRTVIWDFGGEPIPSEMLADVRRFTRAKLPKTLAKLLDQDEQKALRARAAAVASSECFPVDASGHRYPWPLV
jgi:hypothetical protein